MTHEEYIKEIDAAKAEEKSALDDLLEMYIRDDISAHILCYMAGDLYRVATGRATKAFSAFSGL